MNMFPWNKGKSKSKKKAEKNYTDSSSGVEEINPLGNQNSTNFISSNDGNVGYGNTYESYNVGMLDYRGMSDNAVDDLFNSNPHFKLVTEEFFAHYEQNIGSSDGYGMKQGDVVEEDGVDYGHVDVAKEDDVDYPHIDDEDEDEDVEYKPEEDVDDMEDIDELDEGFNTDDSDQEDDAVQAWNAKMQEFHDLYLSVCKWKNWQPPGNTSESVKVESWSRFEMGDDDKVGASTKDRFILPCEPPFEPLEDLEDEKFDWYGQEALCVGSSFKTRKELRRKISEYLLGKKNSYKALRTEPGRYWVKCRLSDCPFKIRATGGRSGWTVYRFVEHTCHFNPSAGAAFILPSKDFGEIMADKIVTPGQVVIPKAVQKELLVNHGMKVNYAQARKIQQRAIEAVYGNEDESFRQIPSYLYMLRRANSGTVCDYMIDESTCKFRYAFFALGSSIVGFTRARPFIAIDGTYLKSKYRGILFVAVTKDANNQIFPLAFSVGGVESRELWSWFLQRVKYSLNCPVGMLIVSDGSKAISGAVSNVFPDARHVLCCYHIQQNLVLYGKRVVELFRRTVWSYNDHDYERAMADLENHCPQAALHLRGVVGEVKFAHVKCPVRRYDIMTTNIVESMNNRLNWARRLPTCSLLEAARSIVEKWFTYRHEKAMQSVGPLTPYAMKKLQDAMEAGSRMLVTPHSETDVLVKHEQRTFRVRLGTRQCQCNVYQHDLIPCPHVAAAIRHYNHNPISYVDEHFRIENLREMWSRLVMPVPAKCDWVTPREIDDAICNPPDNPRQAGRPRMKRHPSGAEGSSHQRKVQQCRRCGDTGHNSKRCTAEIPYVHTVSTSDAGPKRRARKKCGMCGLEGHTAHRCPMRGQFDMNFPAE